LQRFSQKRAAGSRPIALTDLSDDQDTDVRDWATFGLGSQIGADTPTIRAALVRRLSAEDEIARGEALVGLARRKDERVIPLLPNELERDEASDFALEAAAEMGDPSLLPALVRLKERTQDASGSWLQSALDRCGGVGWGG
jgi:HEAT repeat protein